MKREMTTITPLAVFTTGGTGLVVCDKIWLPNAIAVDSDGRTINDVSRIPDHNHGSGVRGDGCNTDGDSSVNITCIEGLGTMFVRKIEGVDYGQTVVESVES